jgi:hypothetical protein
MHIREGQPVASKNLQGESETVGEFRNGSQYHGGA